MNNNSGWILLYREIESHWIWKDPVKLRAWLYLLQNAAYKVCQQELDGIVYECQRGQLVTSLSLLSVNIGMKRSTTRSFLMQLQRWHMVKLTVCSKCTQITICNYDKYQKLPNGEQTQRRRGANAEQTVSKRSQNAGQTLPAHSLKEIKNTNKGKKKKECNSDESHLQKGVCVIGDEVSSFLDFFNEVVAGSPICPVQSLTDSRRDALKACIDTFGADKVRQAVRNALDSDFLCGRASNGFVASFDWLFKPENFIKVLEGNYARREKRNSSDTAAGDLVATDAELDELQRSYLEHERQREEAETGRSNPP